MLIRSRNSFLALTSIGFVLVASVISSALADPPSSTESRIREALKGNVDGQSPTDGILSGVIDVIKQRGSVLDGTVLDETAPDRGALIDDRSANREPSSDSEIDSVASPVTPSDRASVAEQLLKASRMLESIVPHDRERHLLIRQMRREAAELLSE